MEETLEVISNKLSKVHDIWAEIGSTDVEKGEKVVIKMENIEKDVQKGRKQIEKEEESKEEVQGMRISRNKNGVWTTKGEKTNLDKEGN